MSNDFVDGDADVGKDEAGQIAEDNNDQMNSESNNDTVFKLEINGRHVCTWQILANKLGIINSTIEGGCQHFDDGFLCWPSSKVNTTVTLPCPRSIDGIDYDSSHDVSRYCGPDGVWVQGNYSRCEPLHDEPDLPIPGIHLTSMYYIYWIGYLISLVFLILALVVFARFRKLWCLRNIIHCNLILCFALHNLTWISYSLVAHEFLTKLLGLEEVAFCYIPTTVLKYFIAAGFFWMFIEGKFLLISVVFSFHAKRIRFWMCAIVGWVIPLFLIGVTTIAKAKGDDTEACWNEQHHLDYIFIGPVLCILLINVVSLIIIMYVVVTKLQVTVPVEATRYKKAIKALFILCPLLGVNYVFVLIMPSHPLWAKLVFSYYFTVMTSLQGSLVAVLFCFRNNEVWQTIRRSVRRWRRAMGIGGSGGSQKMLRRSMRIDTQSSMMIDLETSSANRSSRRSLAFDTGIANGVKHQNRNAAKRTSNVIVMRDDGELRLFLPSSSTANGGRKTTAPAKLSSRQGSVEQQSSQRGYESMGAKRNRDRYSLPEVRHQQLAQSNSLSRSAVHNVSRSSSSNGNGNRPQQNGRRAVSNYRPVSNLRANDAVDSARTRRARYAYGTDQTSVF